MPNQLGAVSSNRPTAVGPGNLAPGATTRMPTGGLSTRGGRVREDLRVVRLAPYGWAASTGWKSRPCRRPKVGPGARAVTVGLDSVSTGRGSPG